MLAMSTAVPCVTPSDSSSTTLSTQPWSSNTSMSPGRKPRKPIHIYSLNVLADGSIQLLQSPRPQPLATANGAIIPASPSEPAHANLSSKSMNVSGTILSYNLPTYTIPPRGPPRNIYFHRPTTEEIERKKRREKRLVEELQASKELELSIRSSKRKKTQTQGHHGSSVPTDSDASSDAHASSSLNSVRRQPKKRGPKSGRKSKMTDADSNSTLLPIKPPEVSSPSSSAHIPGASSRRPRRNIPPVLFERPLTRSKAGSNDLVTVANTQDKNGDISMTMQQAPQGKETTSTISLVGAAEQLEAKFESESHFQPESANTAYTSSGGSTPSICPVPSFPMPEMAPLSPVTREFSRLTMGNGSNDIIVMEKSSAIEVNMDTVKPVKMKTSRKRKVTEEMEDSSKSDTSGVELRRSGRVTKKRNVVP